MPIHIMWKWSKPPSLADPNNFKTFFRQWVSEFTCQSSDNSWTIHNNNDYLYGAFLMSQTDTDTASPQNNLTKKAQLSPFGSGGEGTYQTEITGPRNKSYKEEQTRFEPRADPLTGSQSSKSRVLSPHVLLPSSYYYPPSLVQPFPPLSTPYSSLNATNVLMTNCPALFFSD